MTTSVKLKSCSRPRTSRQRSHLLGVAVATLAASCFTFVVAQEPPFAGDPACPCLMSVEDGLPPIDPEDLTDDLLKKLGDDVDVSNYGIGCAPHDKPTAQCTSDECVTQTVIPVPVDCDRSWCGRSFCFVDPLNCTLLNRRSNSFAQSGRYYSYATCYDMDSFSNQRLLSSLEGRILRVGFNTNSGGWTGAYNTENIHFEGPIVNWRGPAVNFVTEGAVVGGFRLAITEPPDFLRNRSIDFFSPSKFDYCVYATALGYLDMCVADYTVTGERASSTDWLLLGSEPLYLIVQTDSGTQSKWNEYMSYVATIFQPFTFGAWLFIIFAVIPILGVLMIVHEYNRTGSVFPRSEEVLIEHNDNETDSEVKERRIPIYRHVVKSVYIMLLSVLHQSYDASVVTYGAKLNLLGIAFFILTVIAVYTANLAAILTQEALNTSVDSWEEALSLGYRICGERKNIEDLKFIYGIDDRVFAADPVELGGDGEAGFNCEKCKSRTRVFDYLDFSKAQYDDRYCHAAIAPLQDLQSLQASGKHCNKTQVGQPVRNVQVGMPVNEEVSREVISLFLKLKNDGVYDKELFAEKPDVTCVVEEGGEGSALDVVQLMGIWVVTFAFASVGLCVTWATPYWLKHRAQNNKKNIQRIAREDQWGDPLDPVLESDENDSIQIATGQASVSGKSNRMDRLVQTVHDSSQSDMSENMREENKSGNSNPLLAVMDGLRTVNRTMPDGSQSDIGGDPREESCKSNALLDVMDGQRTVDRTVPDGSQSDIGEDLQEESGNSKNSLAYFGWTKESH